MCVRVCAAHETLKRTGLSPRLEVALNLEFPGSPRTSISDLLHMHPALCALRLKVILARHKYTAERQKSISEQRGACQRPRRHRLFQSCGGLPVHRCSASTSCPALTASAAAATIDAAARSCWSAHCDIGNRCFRSTQGRNRHRCSRHFHRPTTREWDKPPPICICSRWF